MHSTAEKVFFFGANRENVNEDTSTLSAAEMWLRHSSFWQYKCLSRYQQGFLTTVIFNAFDRYIVGTKPTLW